MPTIGARGYRIQEAVLADEQSGVLNGRVDELIGCYGATDAVAAALLCDRWPADALAYRIVRADGSTEELTYGALRDASERCAAALHRFGIRPGDRVATLMGKGRDYLVLLMGIWRLGSVHVPLFTAFAPQAIDYRLSASGARLVVCDVSQRPKLEQIMATGDRNWRMICTAPSSDARSLRQLIDAEDPGFPAARMGGDAPLIHIYTSGTTGLAKGVVVPIRALAAFRAYAEFALHLTPDDLYWCAADPGWAYGLYYGVLATFVTGTPSLLVEGGFEPERTLRIMAEQSVTSFSGAPTIYRSLRALGTEAAPGVALRCAASAGEPLTPDVNNWAHVALGTLVADHYGQTEVGMVINNHNHPLLRRPVKDGSMGQVMPGWSAVVLYENSDELAPVGTTGRLALDMVASPLNTFSGYYGDSALSAQKFVGEGRWYLTGDTASMDEEGYVRFLARDDDLIIMAGYRISPLEVEAVLATHPAVRDSAVIAAPDAIRGEVMEAYIVLDAQVQPSDLLARELQAWVKQHYAAHAFPRTIHFIGELPKTPSGKVQRGVLKQRRADELRTSASVI